MLAEQVHRGGGSRKGRAGHNGPDERRGASRAGHASGDDEVIGAGAEGALSVLSVASHGLDAGHTISYDRDLFEEAGGGAVGGEGVGDGVPKAHSTWCEREYQHELGKMYEISPNRILRFFSDVIITQTVPKYFGRNKSYIRARPGNKLGNSDGMVPVSIEVLKQAKNAIAYPSKGLI
ncbi:hypothetical protein BGZ49_010465 [Haplosporangium sp. Z 27]|nr:hypothetical protein BGZ49_010465 [Haplosporangium sp. Z 27]